MQVDVLTDPRKFLARARPVLESNPAECNIIASLAAHAASSRARDDDDRYLLFHRDGRPVAVAKASPQHGLVVGPLGPEPAEMATVLMETLSGQPLPTVSGPTSAARSVADVWASQAGRQWELQREDVLYAIDSAPARPDVAGSVREQEAADRPWLQRWLADFQTEIHPYRSGRRQDGTATGVRGRRAPRPGADRTMLLWLDRAGLPVSVAGVTPAQAGMSRIGPVFTPTAFRGHGYAAALTAAATALALENGAQRVMLYADRANRTSNGIYQRLGYRQLGDAVLLGLH